MTQICVTGPKCVNVITYLHRHSAACRLRLLISLYDELTYQQRWGNERNAEEGQERERNTKYEE
jgi:hypothetical protein